MSSPKVFSLSLTPDALFVRFFWPLYPSAASSTAAFLDLARATDANPGRNPALMAHLDDAGERFVGNAARAFGADLGLDRTDASVHRLSAALTRDRVDAWARSGPPGSADNILFNVVVHGAAYVGSCVVQNHGASWGVRSPLWESVVRLSSAVGEADLAVFHWWLKSLAGAAEGEGNGHATLADRYRTHVEVPCARLLELPVLFARERPLPRLKQPNYDRLHKYLRAHLPELRDLGPDFPSPERFGAFGFRWMDALVAGGGRGLILALASPAGLHVFWLGASGFEKAVLFQADPFPEPVVRLVGDRLTLITSQSGRALTQEMLWWGP